MELPAVSEKGSGAPALLIHGLGASSHVFSSLIQANLERFHFLTVELPHTGDTLGYCPPEPAVLAQRMVHACRLKGIQSALVVGHSFGGLVALEMAALEPSWVRGLVLASVPAFGLGRWEHFIKLGTANRLMRWAGHLPASRRAVRLYLQRIWGRASHPTDENVAGYLEAAKAKEFLPNLLLAARATLQFKLRTAELRASGIPIEVLWGAEDTLVAPDQGERLARALGVTCQQLDGVGHCLPEERPEAVAAALNACMLFLARG